VPIKNSGIMNPPLHPDVTVTEMAIILKIKIANNRLTEECPFRSSLI
jgi:hypothetical protein